MRFSPAVFALEAGLVYMVATGLSKIVVQSSAFRLLFIAGKLKLELACTRSTSTEKISHAKAQSAAAFLKGFLCAFAPLREKYFFPPMR